MSGPRELATAIFAGIDAMAVDECTRAKFHDLVAAALRSQGHDWHERARRITFARGLLRLREPRPVIRDRLMAAFSISRPQAYRAISEALQLSHECRPSDTDHCSNEPSKSERHA